MANDFKAFGIGVDANVMTQADYAAAAFLINGFSAGIAPSAQLNKAWRQSSVIAYMVAQYISNQTGQDVLDNGDTATLLAQFVSAITIGSGIKPARLFTANGNIAILAADYRIGVARATPAAIQASLPANAQVGQEFHVEDLAKNFGQFPVSVFPPAGDTIAGDDRYVLNVNKQCGIFTKYPNNLWSVKS